MFSDEQLERYARQGYLHVPGVFGAARMARIAGWIDELEAWREVPGRHMMYFEDSRTEPGRRILNRMENFVAYHEDLSALLGGEELLGTAAKLLGAPAVLFKEKINFKLPGGGGFAPHQDVQAGWEKYARLCITAMLTVDRCTVENGCIDVGRWRHRHEMIGEPWRPLHDDELAEVEFVSCPSEPGDVLFFDSFLPHRSAPNLSSRPRRVLYVTYNRQCDGDHRERYFADKRAAYPPDCEREPGGNYEFRV